MVRCTPKTPQLSDTAPQARGTGPCHSLQRFQCGHGKLAQQIIPVHCLASPWRSTIRHTPNLEEIRLPARAPGTLRVATEVQESAYIPLFCQEIALASQRPSLIVLEPLRSLEIVDSHIVDSRGIHPVLRPVPYGRLWSLRTAFSRSRLCTAR